MAYSLDFKTSEVWKGDNHVLGSDYRAECLNVKAYQAYMTDPTKQSDSFFRKQNGKCRIWSKEEVRKENIKRNEQGGKWGKNPKRRKQTRSQNEQGKKTNKE